MAAVAIARIRVRCRSACVMTASSNRDRYGDLMRDGANVREPEPELGEPAAEAAASRARRDSVIDGDDAAGVVEARTASARRQVAAVVDVGAGEANAQAPAPRPFVPTLRAGAARLLDRVRLLEVIADRAKLAASFEPQRLCRRQR